MKVADTGWWHLRVEPLSTDDFNRRLGHLFDLLTPDCATWRDLSGRYSGNLFVGLFLESSSEGLIIDPDTAAAIGARGLRLELDIYGPDAD